MSLGKILAITASMLLAIIGFGIIWKSPKENLIQSEKKPSSDTVYSSSQEPIEIAFDIDLKDVTIKEPELPQELPIEQPLNPVIKAEKPLENFKSENFTTDPIPQKIESLPEENRIEELFSITGKKLPFVETVTYKSRVSWQKGRPAWLSDYASHYDTSRHFIARSLNGKPDYLKQEVAEGNKFNVFKQEHPLEFQMVVDVAACKMWFYALSGKPQEKILLKTYKVSLGRPDSSKESSFLTPLGKYQLGSRIAIYKPKVMGHYKGQKTEMIQIFGTRWIPFDKAIGETTAPPKGFGLHGVPWVKNKKGELEQDLSSLGKFESDGCVRLATDDIEEIFAIVITKPAFIELVKDISQSELFRK